VSYILYNHVSSPSFHLVASVFPLSPPQFMPPQPLLSHERVASDDIDPNIKTPSDTSQGLATPAPNTDISNLQISSQPYPSNLFSPLFHPSVHPTRHLETFSCHLSFIKDVSFSLLTQLPTPISPIIHHVHPTSQLHASPHLGPKPAT